MIEHGVLPFLEPFLAFNLSMEYTHTLSGTVLADLIVLQQLSLPMCNFSIFDHHYSSGTITRVTGDTWSDVPTAVFPAADIISGLR